MGDVWEALIKLDSKIIAAIISTVFGGFSSLFIALINNYFFVKRKIKLELEKALSLQGKKSELDAIIPILKLLSKVLADAQNTDIFDSDCIQVNVNKFVIKLRPYAASTQKIIDGLESISSLLSKPKPRRFVKLRKNFRTLKYKKNTKKVQLSVSEFYSL